MKYNLKDLSKNKLGKKIDKNKFDYCSECGSKKLKDYIICNTCALDGLEDFKFVIYAKKRESATQLEQEKKKYEQEKKQYEQEKKQYEQEKKQYEQEKKKYKQIEAVHGHQVERSKQKKVNYHYYTEYMKKNSLKFKISNRSYKCLNLATNDNNICKNNEYNSLVKHEGEFYQMTELNFLRFLKKNMVFCNNTFLNNILSVEFYKEIVFYKNKLQNISYKNINSFLKFLKHPYVTLIENMEPIYKSYLSKEIMETLYIAYQSMLKLGTKKDFFDFNKTVQEKLDTLKKIIKYFKIEEWKTCYIESTIRENTSVAQLKKINKIEKILKRGFIDKLFLPITTDQIN